MPTTQRIDVGDGVTLERGVPFRLSDGTTLVSDHYYAAGPAPKPTLLMRQPYGRDIASTVVYAHPVWFARRGYNVVIQDVRGRGGSEGSFYPFRHEGPDGAETIAWLLTRPECNGRIGMYGFSYQGATQLLAAAERPAGLQCIAPAMTACDLYAGWFYHHGALRLGSSLGWGLQMLKEDAQRLNLREASDQLEAAWANLPAQPRITPYADHPALADPQLPTYVRDWFTHTSPGDYWSAMDVSARPADIAVPALHVSGWYDTYLEGSVAGFELLRAHSSAPGGQYLLAGPWVHIPWGDRVGDIQLGPEALLDTDTLLLRWFDHWLKGANTWAAEPRVRHFALGANAWFASEACEGEAETVLYLCSGGRAESRKGDGVLMPGEMAPGAKVPFGAALVPGAEAPGYLDLPGIAGGGGSADWFSYDPEVPVMSPAGAGDQSAVEMGNNLLVYTGPLMTEPLHVFGRPTLAVWIATSARCADVTAKLVRVTAAGRAEFVCMGVARSTWLFGEAYAADLAQRWEFTLEPTSCVFARGDRIRLEVAGCAFPLYDRNPGDPSVAPSQASRWNWTRSTHTLFHDQEHPSALHLPTLQTPEGAPA